MQNKTISVKQYIQNAIDHRSEFKDKSWISELSEVFGKDNVIFDEATITNYSYDTWPVSTKWKNQGKRYFSPDVVVKPRTTEQVSEILKWASSKKISVTPWGGGSSVTGQPLATRGGIILDMTGMNKVIALDETSLMLNVQTGKFGHHLEQELNDRGYTLNHSPQSLDRSTVGGWIATRATGQFSSKYGGIEDLLISFTVVLPTGEIVETLHSPRSAVGPNVQEFFIGAEGTLGIVTEARIKIFRLSKFKLFEAITFPSVDEGLKALREISQSGIKPYLARFYDIDEAKHAMVDKEFDHCVMFLGFDGLETTARAEYTAACDICASHSGKKIGSAPVDAWMKRRFSFETVENLLNEPGGLAETIEIAHFWGEIEETYNELKTALAPKAAEVLGHFSHIYPQGVSLYVILLGKCDNDQIAEETILEIWDIVMRVCLKNGATLSHHHGAGLVRQSYIPESLGSSLEVIKKVKNALDPSNIMNPDKLGL